MPRTHSDLFRHVYDFENLYQAYLRARRNKRYRRDVLQFHQDLEGNLIQIQNQLIWKTYKNGEYRRFWVSEPKPREILALPFADRVVQHSLVHVVEPLFERKMIRDSYACRAGKGTHAGANRLTEFLRTSPPDAYCLKADISKYFPSIDHGVIKKLVRRTIRCPDTLWLLDHIIDSAPSDPLRPRGLPIGNLTSQLLANIYLNELDHFVKETLRVRHYLRYMDDFVILAEGKRRLWEIRREVELFLDQRLGLALNPKTDIFPARSGVDFIGYRIWPGRRRLRRASVTAMRRRVRRMAVAHAKGQGDPELARAVFASWVGHARYAGSDGLVRNMREVWLEKVS